MCTMIYANLNADLGLRMPKLQWLWLFGLYFIVCGSSFIVEGTDGISFVSDCGEGNIIKIKIHVIALLLLLLLLFI